MIRILTGRLATALAAIIVAVAVSLLSSSAVTPLLADSGSGSGGGSGSGSGGSGDGNRAADISLSANYGPSFTGHLDRGAVPGSPCADCNGMALPQPAYVVNSLGWFYDGNSIGLVSLNDFAGTVTLEVLNLPPGVTSAFKGRYCVMMRPRAGRWGAAGFQG